MVDAQRLAAIAEVPVNWCPGLGTVLANEEVTAEGRSERGNFPVFKRPLRQWQLRITAYAERLIDDLELVDWPEPVKLMQRNRVGRSEGALVDFILEGDHRRLRAFTTRPDTLFCAAYMVLAPAHPWVRAITTVGQRGGAEAADHAERPGRDQRVHPQPGGRDIPQPGAHVVARPSRCRRYPEALS